MNRQVKNYFNQEKLKLEKMLEIQDFTFNLEVCKTYGFEYYEELDKNAKEFFEEMEDTKLPTTFKIVGDFDILKSVDEEDLSAFLVAAVNIFASYLIIPKTSNGNGRFAVPKSMDGIRLSSMIMRDMANRLMKFPQFRIEVLNLKGESVFEVF
jgi:hypothetical protein